MSVDLVEGEGAPDKVVLLYDYSKHLLSLALLGVGGIVSLSQSPQGQKIPVQVVSIVLVCLALSGVCALTCTSAILRARQRDEAVGRSAWLASQGSMLFLGVGVGGFLSIWIRTLA
jgi:ABC-type transport system involved in cytochrome c biogenesis permease subunit